MQEIQQLVLPLTFKKGEIIYRPGDLSTALYIVSEGKVHIYQLSEGGKEQLLRILSPGDYMGELALFRESTHDAFASAIVDTHICSISRNDFQALLEKFPSISLRVLIRKTSDPGRNRKSRDPNFAIFTRSIS
jgi:CRP/FNR family transcriptional regulator